MTYMAVLLDGQYPCTFHQDDETGAMEFYCDGHRRVVTGQAAPPRLGQFRMVLCDECWGRPVFPREGGRA